MSKYERDKLVRQSRSALDSLFEIGHMEQLSIEEFQELDKIYNKLEGVVSEVHELISGIDERKKKEREAKPIPRNYNGPVFSWAKHEERAKLRQELRKAEAELSKLEQS